MQDKLLAITRHFRLDSPAVECVPFGNGIINKTYCVTSESGRRYIMQRLSEDAFKDIPALMNNLRLITDYLSAHSEGEPVIIFPVETDDGKNYLHTGDGYFRITPYAENTVAMEAPRNDDDFYRTALAFGSFISSLADFPADSLVETIPNFHNTVDRYRLFHEALDRNISGRADEAGPEIRYLLDHEEEMGRLQHMRESGELPTRVTHNDTKLNNVLFDADTYQPKYVIDLDTVMPGLSLYDYGDCIRFGANTAAEDEPNTDLVGIDLNLFRIFTRGFLTSCKGLTEKEIDMMPLGAKTITIELAMRFLSDYLNGDTYFTIKYADHNLVRCRAQLKLAASMEENWETMCAIVVEEREHVRSKK